MQAVTLTPTFASQLKRQGGRNGGSWLSFAAQSSQHLASPGAADAAWAAGRRGNSAYFSIADESVHALCDLVCGSIARQLERAASGRAAFAVPGARRTDARSSV